MKFSYVAFDSNGKKIKGVVDAENETGAIYHIRNQNMSPISVAPYKEKAASWKEIEILEPDVHKLKIKKKDLMQFADKMSIMLFTSGTTGTAKCVMLCQKNIWSTLVSACSTVEFFPDDTIVSVLPLHRNPPEEAPQSVKPSSHGRRPCNSLCRLSANGSRTCPIQRLMRI